MEYNFCLHVNKGNEAVAHSVAIAPTGGGKTTFYQYLIFNALQNYDDLRVYMFDSLNGMAVFTNFMDGKNIEFFANNIELNPFQIDLDNNDNIVFLEKFLLMLSDAEDEEREYINKFIKLLKYVPIEKRDIKGLLDYGFPRHSQIHSKLTVLLESSSAKFLNGKLDSLDIKNSRLVNFQMKEVMDDEKISAAVIYYVMFRIRQQVKENAVPHLIFVDETSSMVKNKYFKNELAVLLEQHRKLRGSINVAFQNADTFLRDESLSQLIKNQCQTVFIFYNPGAMDYNENYRELQIDEVIFEEYRSSINTSNNTYQILLKKPKEQLILNADISWL